MNELTSLFSGPNTPTTPENALLSLLTALALGQAIGAVYMWTFGGLSYTRSFVFAVVTGSVITCMLMLALGNSLAAGIGIAGGMALIRFRTSMRDPRDLIFVLASLSAGVACGLKAWGPAIIGAAIFIAGAVIFTYSDFGARERADGLLRVQVPTGPDAERGLADVLQRHTRSFALVTLREAAQGGAMQHAYQVRLRSAAHRTPLLLELERLEGTRDISLLLQEPTVEI
jgi:hypothetical protein